MSLNYTEHEVLSLAHYYAESDALPKTFVPPDGLYYTEFELY